MVKAGANISFAFQAIHKLYADFTNLCSAVFCIWVIFGKRDFFSKD